MKVLMLIIGILSSVIALFTGIIAITYGTRWSTFISAVVIAAISFTVVRALGNKSNNDQGMR
jgi:hypothetical protein